ncbi:MAG: Na/Pi cotransporter family protein [Ruminococcaceae bacterium]|nr:Na/Pi cotransporter family protein [Oscillospiraceae bacterium]
MTPLDILKLIGGLCLFLFGMNVMGQALERRAGGKLQSLLSKLTSNKFAGLLTGLCVTAVIQSSSATTVMVVGFVNSGLMTLKQAINVIMGANVGTTITAWILSLSGISSKNIFVQLLKPTAFTPVLALIGIVFYMFCKSTKKKDTGTILLGFAVLMFGMDTMSASVSGLSDVPAFAELFIMFKNPILGVLAGAILTAIIQSSSASVGILQALATTGLVSYGAAIPIIMGQNIGTCITALLSSFGTNRNAKRAALVHLSFNVIGTIVCLIIFTVVDIVLSPAFFDTNSSLFGIAVAHSVFNLACTLILLPMSSLLEKLAYRLVPETQTPDEFTDLDERLLTTPTIALERCHEFACEMADNAIYSLKQSLACLKEYSEDTANEVRELENKTDRFEDVMGTYLVKLSTHQISDRDSAEAAKLLKIIGDLERISDHATNIVDSAEEMRDKNLTFSNDAVKELENLCDAVEEILNLTLKAFVKDDLNSANTVEPLEQVIDILKDKLRSGHISRLQQGICSIETGFVWSDILTNLERTSDHCSNIAGCVVDALARNLNLHESIRVMKAEDPHYKEQYSIFADKYLA